MIQSDATTGTLRATEPLWLVGAPPPLRPPLRDDRDCDVAVIGGGIAGVTTALLLQRAGAQVVLLDRARICGGATGSTTAKVSALQQTKLSDVRRIHGAAGAAAYAAASAGAVERIAAFVAEGIACDWERLAAYTYAAGAEQEPGVRDEVAAAQEAGLPVELVDDPPLPFAVSMAACLPDQAQFDPVRYTRGLADLFEAAGGVICEESPVVEVHDGAPCRVTTDAGFDLRARDVIVCTNYPLLDRGLFFARTEATRSYLVAARLRDTAPRGMFISAGEPTRSLRPYTDAAGDPWVLVGGEGHTTGSSDAQPERYALLEEFARSHFDVIDIPHRWSTQDASPVDKLPYAGSYSPLSRHLFVNAGGQKWGMTNGTAGALILAERFAGGEHPQARTFDPNRLAGRALPGLAKDNVRVGAHFVGDRIRPAGDDIEGIAPGSAAVLRSFGVARTGVYRDDAGALHAVSVRCTHLGCLLHFNDAERSWDCPCHGSRFGVDGDVLAGPATTPLERREV